MKLYSSPISVNAKRVLVLARELNMPLEIISLDLRSGDHRTAAYLAKNPMGKVPTLEDGDFVLWESPAIMIHLVRRYSASELFPAEHEVELLRWMFWNASHLEPAIFCVAVETFVKPRMLDLDPDPARIDAGTKDFERYAPILDAHLTGKNWILNDRISIADIAIGAPAELASTLGLLNEGHRALSAWLERLRARPSWK